MARGPVRRRGGGVGAFLLWIFALAVATGIFGLAFLMSAIERPGPMTRDAVFVVESGASGADIASALEQQNLITNAMLFRLANRVYGRGQSLQAGEYAIPADASVRDIVEMLTNGDAVQHAITFPEGVTIAGVMRIIETSDVLTGDMPETPPEGSVLPETYHVQRGMTRAALLQQMRDAHDEALAEIWAGRDPDVPVTTPEELVILASIVERETGMAEERPQVAAVFVNRLRRGMRLESDPTIIYGVCLRFADRCVDGRLVNAQGQRRTIRQSEIDLDTGYNTYRIDRLPPTPIANPGRASLEATAHPADTDALFFVADGTGGHVFARTNAEHEANVARWRQIEAQRLAQERAE
jgi:UPF0755 protein